MNPSGFSRGRLETRLVGRGRKHARNPEEPEIGLVLVRRHDENAAVNRPQQPTLAVLEGEERDE